RQPEVGSAPTGHIVSSPDEFYTSSCGTQEEPMRTKTWPGRLLVAAGAALAASLSVDLATTRGPSTGVGEGFLYGISSDGTQPVDQYLKPLGINAFRGGG